MLRNGQATSDDPISGTWECLAVIPQMGEVPMTVTLERAADGTVSGSLSSSMFSMDLTGTFNQKTMILELDGEMENGPSVAIRLTVDGDAVTGTGTPDTGGPATQITGTRVAPEPVEDDAANDVPGTVI